MIPDKINGNKSHKVWESGKHKSCQILYDIKKHMHENMFRQHTRKTIFFFPYFCFKRLDIFDNTWSEKAYIKTWTGVLPENWQWMLLNGNVTLQWTAEESTNSRNQFSMCCAAYRFVFLQVFRVQNYIFPKLSFFSETFLIWCKSF